MNTSDLEKLKQENEALLKQLTDTHRKVDRLLELVVELNNKRTQPKSDAPRDEETRK